MLDNLQTHFDPLLFPQYLEPSYPEIRKNLTASIHPISSVVPYILQNVHRLSMHPTIYFSHIRNGTCLAIIATSIRFGTINISQHMPKNHCWLMFRYIFFSVLATCRLQTEKRQTHPISTLSQTHSRRPSLIAVSNPISFYNN